MTIDIVPIGFHVTVSQYVVAGHRKIRRAFNSHLVIELLQIYVHSYIALWLCLTVEEALLYIDC